MEGPFWLHPWSLAGPWQGECDTPGHPPGAALAGQAAGSLSRGSVCHGQQALPEFGVVTAAEAREWETRVSLVTSQEHESRAGGPAAVSRQVLGLGAPTGSHARASLCSWNKWPHSL